MTINLSQSLVVTGVGGFDEWKIEKKKNGSVRHTGDDQAKGHHLVLFKKV